MVRDGETGLLTPEGDALALASAVETLLADPIRRGEMVFAARAHVQAQHDIASAARMLHSSLTPLIQGR